MKLSVPLAIPSGTPISIQTLRQDIPAIVHWYDKGYIGVNLLDRLDSPTLIALESADDVLAKFR